MLRSRYVTLRLSGVPAYLKRPVTTSKAPYQLQMKARLKTANSANFLGAASRELSSSVRGDGEVSEPPLPSYVPREGESVEVKRARLLYQSRYETFCVHTHIVYICTFVYLWSETL